MLLFVFEDYHPLVILGNSPDFGRLSPHNSHTIIKCHFTGFTYKSADAVSGENQRLPFVLKYLTDVWVACFMDNPFVILQSALPNATCIFEIIFILLRLPTSSTISIYGTSDP
jgi:hypothetical protein